MLPVLTHSVHQHQGMVRAAASSAGCWRHRLSSVRSGALCDIVRLAILPFLVGFLLPILLAFFLIGFVNMQIDLKMQPVPGHANLFHFDGRTLQLTGRRKDPLLLKDDKTGQVLWDRTKNTKFSNPWARQHFKISTSGDAVTITNKKRDSVVCECVGVDHSEGDPFLMQVCVSKAGRILQNTFPV